MSFSSLGIGASALTAAQRAMETAAHNVANVNTEGYTRQRIELRAAEPVPGTFGRRGDGMRGMGVTIADVVRVRSNLIDTNYRAQASTEAGWSARAEVMGRAEQVLGPFGEGTPAALAEFWAGWEELSLHPDNPAARRGVLDAGASLARSLRSAASQLDQLGADTAAQVREGVGEVNRLAGQIARLNAGIADATVGAQTPSDLLDQRDLLLDRLSALTGASVRPSDFGRVDVFLGSMALVRGESTETLHVSDVDPATLGWNPGGTDNLIVGGRLGALVDAGGSTLVGLQNELDTFARDLAKLVNDTHRTGWDGRQPPQPGGDFFTGGASDFAVALTDTSFVAASATQAGAPTDGNHALLMAGLRNVQLQSGKTPGDALHDFAGRLGGLAAEAFDSAAASGEVLAAVSRERAELSSVSTDEELTDMLRYQRAYEAAARVITSVDEMLDVLINRTGLVGR